MEPASAFSQGLPEPRPHARTVRPARPAAALLAAALATVAALAATPAPASEPLTPAATAGEEQPAELTARPDTVSPGDVVTLTGAGFPADARLEVGAGPPHSQYEVLDWTQADAEGRVVYDLLLPLRAEPGQEVVFVMATEDFSVKAVSNTIIITGASPAAVAAVR